MRIVLFHFAELGAMGGVETAVITLANALVHGGCAVSIVEIAPEGRPARTLPNGVDVYTVAASVYPKLDRPRSWASFARSAIQFHSVLKRFQPDIVHVHYPIAQCLPVVANCWFSHNWKLVVTVHGSDIRFAPVQELRIRPWQQRLFRIADALSAVNPALLENAATRYDGFRVKFRVIPNGVGPQWFLLPPTTTLPQNYVLYAGRLHPVKGVDILLHAWKSVSAEMPDLKLWIVGDGPERQNLFSLAADLGLTSTVQFLGTKDKKDLPLLYRNAAVVVLPSRAEGLPIGLLEAGASGALSVATRIPGNSEIIEHGVNGILVPPESPEELAKGLLQTLRMPPEFLATMRDAARETVRRRFSEEKVVSEYLDVYRSLL
jgi:glycosyltransferase involved in cell wall biosynthesis